MKFASCLVLVAALAVSGCGGDGGGSTPTAPSLNVSFSTTDLKPGTGAEATLGRVVTVRYAGWVYSATAPDNKGQQFDAGTIPALTLGTTVIQGFTMGVQGMRVGGLRRVVIPPNLGYGNSPPPNSGIRANETLLFEIELLAVQ
jgi:FKBP-type peptidyl-prolyl cis-trans isomerase